MHPRISVHSVCFPGAPLVELDGHWQGIGVRRVSLISTQLGGDSVAYVRDLIERHGYAVEAVTHAFAGGALPTATAAVATCRDRLKDAIDASARIGARVVYLITGGRGALPWEAAADAFSAALAPCVAHARKAGVALAIENASNLYVDIHLAHTLRDTIALAEMAGVGICLDHFHGWTEAGFYDLVARALPRLELVQLSDYVLGDRTLPARAVPGDGAIPIAPFVAQVLAGGYRHAFDLELLGPRIDAEGHGEAVMRAATVVGAMLETLGG
jgi:sugar phosphate isomerase/epimerase